jgi:hypothetical protein
MGMIAHKLYRLLPRARRLQLLDILPPERRLRLVRRLTRQRALGPSATAGDLVRARDRGRSVLARVVVAATPAQAWRRNLDAVVAVLDAAQIDYFCLRPLRYQHSAVAVAVDDRARTLAALRYADDLCEAQVRVGEFVDRDFRASKGGRGGVQVYFPVTDPRGITVLGGDFACEIEFWLAVPGEDDAPDSIVGPRGNQVATALPVDGEIRHVGASALSHFMPLTDVPPRYRTRAEFASDAPGQVRFPIDAVYTWVDGGDPDWLRRKNTALGALGEQQINTIAANASRFISRDELRYSLRSMAVFAPWIRRIFLVTDDQIPPWLDDSDPRLTVVSHRELFVDTGVLPTFNSHAIESRLHRIPGLAEHFIYFNDDMFFGRPVLPTAFFHANGIAKFFQSTAQVEAGPATVYDAPVTAAGKNNRRHIEECFGRSIAQKMQHVPYALRKSVLMDIERTLPGEVLRTAEHQFRHPGDLSIPSSLQHYWAFLTGRAVPGSIKYTYADLAHPSTPLQLAFLLAKRRYDVFCLNDTDSAEVALAEQAAMMADFLPRYFPFRSPFELPDDVAAQRSASSATWLARAAQAGANQAPRRALKEYAA